MNAMPQSATAASFCRGCHGTDQSRIGEKDGYALLRCADCKTVVVDPYPTPEQLNAFYQNYGKSEQYMRKKDSKLRRSLKRAKRMLSEKPPGKKFLDVGCSVGFMTEAARMAGCESFGIDIDDTAVNIAREHFKDCKFETIDIAKLAERGDTFDMVYMSEVIEHVPDPDGFMAAVSKVMNKGALLYITAPDAGHFGVPREFTKWDMVVPPHHLTYLTRDGMKRLLTRHGITVEKFQIAFKPGMKAFARKN